MNFVYLYPSIAALANFVVRLAGSEATLQTKAQALYVTSCLLFDPSNSILTMNQSSEIEVMIDKYSVSFPQHASLDRQQVTRPTMSFC